MTEQPPNINELSPQDEALLALLDASIQGEDPIHSETSDSLDRETLEACGLLAQSLDPAPVSADARSALFARLGLEGLEGTAEPQRAPASVTPFPTAPAASAQPPVVAPPVPMSNFAPWALAATVLLALGLALWGGFMWSEVRQSRTVIASLTDELDRMTAESANFQQVRYENQQLRTHLATAIQPSSRVCALSATAPDQPQAKGAVFMSPEDGRWVLAAQNLAKCELGRRYRLWFVGPNGEYSGGEMLEHVNGEAEVELAAGELPEGTEAILLTLEFPDQFGPEPAGERVLFGDRSIGVF